MPAKESGGNECTKCKSAGIRLRFFDSFKELHNHGITAHPYVIKPDKKITPYTKKSGFSKGVSRIYDASSQSIDSSSESKKATKTLKLGDTSSATKVKEVKKSISDKAPGNPKT